MTTTKISTRKPKGYERDLSPYGPQIYDSGCCEPIAWGFAIQEHLGDDRWYALHAFGAPTWTPGMWVLVIKRLTPRAAARKYGPMTSLRLGPAGGFREVTYGTTRFLAKQMDPRPYIRLKPNDKRVTIEPRRPR